MLGTALFDCLFAYLLGGTFGDVLRPVDSFLDCCFA